MAVVLQGFLGPFTGKVGGAVGGIWKGINYIKGYVIPANPNTAGQQAQRGKFAEVVKLAQNLLPTLISNYWNPFAIKMSGYNYFIQQFINSCSSTGFAQATSIFTKGTLEPAPKLSSATYGTSNGAITIYWDDTVSGNGLITDNISAIAIDARTNTVLGSDYESVARSVGSLVLTVATGLTASDIMIYYFASRGTGSSFMVSDSIGQQCAAD